MPSGGTDIAACCGLGSGEGSGDGGGAECGLGFLEGGGFGMVAGPVLVDEGCLHLNLGLGLAWVLLPDAVVLGQVFLQCLGVLGFRFLLSLADFVDSVLGSHLRYLIRILRSLRLGLELEVVLVLVVGLPSLLE